MLSQDQIHALQNAATQAWSDDTRPDAFRGHPVPAVGQCYVTSRWLQSKLGGHVGRKDGCYFWTDGKHALDICGDRHVLPPADPSIEGIRLDEEDPGLRLHPEHLRWRTAPMLYKRTTHPIFAGHEVIPDIDPEPRTVRFMSRADRALEGRYAKLAFDLGDAYPGEEAQAVENYNQRYLHDTPGAPDGPKTYNVVYGNGNLHLSADDSHEELARQAGIPVDHTGPFAAGFVTVNMGSANWQLRSNIALHALERVLKDYDKHVGWEWGGLVDSSGQPINDDFAPKKSSRLIYAWLPDTEHLLLARSAWDLATAIEADYGVGPREAAVTGAIHIEGAVAKVARFRDRPYLFTALSEWATDSGLRLMAGDNVVKRIEDLQTDNLWSPTDNEPEGGQFFNEPQRDERAPGGVFKCPECDQIFPRWDLYIRHREQEEPMGTTDTTVQPSKFPELPDQDATFPPNFSEQSFEPTNVVAAHGRGPWPWDADLATRGFGIYVYRGDQPVGQVGFGQAWSPEEIKADPHAFEGDVQSDLAEAANWLAANGFDSVNVAGGDRLIFLNGGVSAVVPATHDFVRDYFLRHFPMPRSAYPDGPPGPPGANFSRFEGVILRTSNAEADKVPGVNHRYFRHAESTYYTAYENGSPVGCAALEGPLLTWISSPVGFHVTDAILSRLQRVYTDLHMHLAAEYSPDGQRLAATEEFHVLTRMGFIHAGHRIYRWSADQDPSKLLEGAVPFIYDVDEDSVTVGHPGERHSDIQGKFTPGGIVEGTYEPGGKVIVRSLTNMPYTVRHMLELWYYQHPEFVIKSVHLRDDAGNDTKLARVARPVDEGYWEDETQPELARSRYQGWPKWEKLYHGTTSSRAADITRQGLRPWDELGQHNWDPRMTPRPGHVYLTNDKDFAWNIAPTTASDDATVVEVDPRYLDPENINPDEDATPTGMWDTGEYDNKGRWAEGVGLGDNPELTQVILESDQHHSLAHQGTIPPHAIVGTHVMTGISDDGPGGWKFAPNPAYQPVSARPITSNMEIGQHIANLVAQDDLAWRVYQALKQEGGHVYVVGGAVRDAVMGEAPKDLDLMVTGLPHQQVLAALRRLPGKVMQHGQDFSVIRYRQDGEVIEIALPRRERSTGPEHTDFDVQADHTMTPEEDFARRDFNVNAMGVDLDTGKLVDPYGGADAIRHGTFSTTSTKSFEDDPLRIMRALALNARHGLEPDEMTKAQMAMYADRLVHLPADRKRNELFKMFGLDPETREPKPAPYTERSLRLAHETGTLPYFLPGLARTMGFEQYNPHHPEGDLGEHNLLVLRHAKQLGAHPLLQLAAANHDNGKVDSQWFECKPCSQTDHATGLRVKNPIPGKVCPTCGQDGEGHYYEWRQENPNGSRTVWGADHAPLGADQFEQDLRDLRVSNDDIGYMTHIVRHHMFPAFHSTNGARKFINKVGDENADDLLLLRQADQGGKLEYPSDPKLNVDKQRELVNRVREAGEPTNASHLAINGHDLIRAGFTPGPQMGEVLRHLTDIVLEDPAANNPETLLSAARMYDA